MAESFASILAVGGKTNSLGRAEEVVQTVLQDKSRLEELYQCLAEDDAWLRMRAADSFEKICRVHPEWCEPYTDRLLDEYGQDPQPSIQWHMAQLFAEVRLTPAQKQRATDWLVAHLQTLDVDWIVAANAMDTLAAFTRDGVLPQQAFVKLLEIQQHHHSNSVVKRATKHLASLRG